MPHYGATWSNATPDVLSAILDHLRKGHPETEAVSAVAKIFEVEFGVLLSAYIRAKRRYPTISRGVALAMHESTRELDDRVLQMIMEGLETDPTKHLSQAIRYLERKDKRVDRELDRALAAEKIDKAPGPQVIDADIFAGSAAAAKGIGYDVSDAGHDAPAELDRPAWADPD